MKKKTVIQKTVMPRTGKVKRIRILAETDIEQATNLASFGRELSETESQIAFYRVWNQSLRAKLAKEIGVPVESASDGRYFLQDIFFQAIENGNPGAIKEIADALKNVLAGEEFSKSLDRAKKARTRLLLMKRKLLINNKTIPLCLAAKRVGDDAAKSGYPMTKQICEEIHFPLTKE